MRSLLLFLLPTFVGCGATWGLRDEDGDGKSILDGDCWDAPDGGADIGPDAAEIWYDGIDQNCDGLSDFDQDGDGFDALGSGEGTDCWDDPTVTPTGFSAINGFDALTAADVYDGAADRWYDGIDANCDGMSDFDQDGDGFDTENADYGPPDGSGTDCYDGADVDDYPGDGTETTLLDPADVYPREETDETWYDGTDGNCDEWDDYDQDRDGYPLDEECNDLDPLIFPDETVEEIWYNDVDENCDGNLYDKDGDGFESALYGGTDCWDDPEDMPADFEVMHGRTQPAANQVYPGNEDDTWYDGVDADCAGNSDFDQDLDGYDTDELENRAGVTGTDCEDEDSEAYPGASEIWYNDVDNDCLGGSDYDADGDGFDYDAEISTGTDCDDARPEVNTDANEACGTTYDDNCDGDLDLLDATDCITWNYDGDGDTYGTASTECWCEAQVATNFDASNDDDCDDASASDYPGATESVANGDDEDCDGGDTCYVDGDSDGYRNEDTTLTVDSTDLDCNDSGEGASTELATDCNDSNAGVSPGDAEIVADGIDQDCDDGDTCYVDADSDGYRSETTTLTVTSVDLDCTDSGEGASTEPATDCNDSDATVSPADSEVVADSIDQDCDDVDSCYTDADGDNYGTTVVVDGSTLSCVTGTGAANDDDCDDASSTDYPGATESVANNDDEDCDGVDSCYTDSDGDNYGTTVVVDGSSLNCSSGTGAPVSTDCDDSDADTFPGSAASELTTSCTNDDDGDGYGDSTVSALYVEGTDCNDASSSISPAASDTVADGIDQDCDNVDTCYTDSDGDNFGTTATSDGSSLSCSTGTGAAVSTDCDDSDADTFPGSAALELTTSCTNDDDNDGYGDETVSALYVEGTDCNDGSSSVYTGATETVADGIDQDCDDVDTCYTDSDGDNFGTTVTVDGSTLSCSTGTGAAVSTDCDDSDADTFPGSAALELTSSCTNDDDNDGYGDETVSALYVEGTDCNDASSTISPVGTETVADGIDQDCDDVDTCYTDSDGDNFGSTSTSDGSTLSCSTGTGSTVSTDCDDSDADTFPGSAALELTSSCTNDDDNDGYGDETVSALYVEGTDCDDSTSAVSPVDTETVADGIDQDCDDVDSCYTDADGDGYGTTVVTDGSSLSCSTGTGADNDDDCSDGDEYVYPGATELCDGQYNNCTTSGSWTAADEDDIVTKVTTGGVASNVTISSTTSLDSTGTYYFCAGTYATKLVGSSDTVSVIGYYGAASTILDAVSGSTVSVTNGSVTLDGFTIQGGTGTGATTQVGGGVIAGGTATLTLTDCIVTGNDADEGAGVAVTSSASVLLSGTTVSSNVATDQGGGVWVSATGELELASNSVITANSAVDGGGIYMDGAGILNIDTSSVHTNVATSDGGGIYLGSGSLALTGADVYGNTAADGAGIWIDLGAGSCDSTSGIFANTASNRGGGVYIDDEDTNTFVATNCDFTGTGDNSPDDVNAYDGTGTHISYLDYGSTATFTCTVLGVCSPANDP